MSCEKCGSPLFCPICDDEDLKIYMPSVNELFVLESENEKLKRELVIVKEKGLELFNEIYSLRQQNQTLITEIEKEIEFYADHGWTGYRVNQLKKVLKEVKGE